MLHYVSRSRRIAQFARLPWKESKSQDFFFFLINACAEPELLSYERVKENGKHSGLHFFFTPSFISPLFTLLFSEEIPSSLLFQLASAGFSFSSQRHEIICMDVKKLYPSLQ